MPTHHFPTEYKTSDQDTTPFQTKRIAALSTSHGVSDLYAGFLSPLLPVLIKNMLLTKTEAGLLSVFQLAPSLLQPVIGHLADHISLRYLVILAPAISGVTMSLLGIMPSYLLVAVLLVFAGLSSASLHAVGPVMAGRLSGKKLGRGMSIWMVGGSLGYGMGPIVLVITIKNLSLASTPWLMIFGILTSVMLFFWLKDVPGRPPHAEQALALRPALQHMKPIMIPIAGIIIMNALMVASLNTFLPIFLTERGSSLVFAGASLSVLQVAGVVGVTVAGPASDRLGRRSILFILQITAFVFMFALISTNGWIHFVILLVLGFTMLSIIPIFLALVQENSPDNRALANGILLGIMFVSRSIAAIIVGLLGDNFGLQTAFTISALSVILSLPLIFVLPK